MAANAARGLAVQAHLGIARLLASFSNAQIEELLQSFDRKNAKFIKKLKKTSSEEIAWDYRKSMVDDLEHWMGKLSEIQVAIVADWSRSFRPLGLEGLIVRRTWQKELLEVLRYREQPFTQFGARVNAYIEKRRDNPSGKYRQKLEHNKAETAKMLAAVLAKIDEKQRTHLDRKIDNLRNDLSALVCRSDMPKPNKSSVVPSSATTLIRPKQSLFDAVAKN